MRDRTRYEDGTKIRPDMRVAALAEAWFRDVSSGDRSPSTLVQYRYRLDRQIIPALGELRVRELTPGTIDRHLTSVTAKHGTAAARTVRSVLSGMAGLAARNDALDRARKVIALRGPQLGAAARYVLAGIRIALG